MIGRLSKREPFYRFPSNFFILEGEYTVLPCRNTLKSDGILINLSSDKVVGESGVCGLLDIKLDVVI